MPEQSHGRERETAGTARRADEAKPGGGGAAANPPQAIDYEGTVNGAKDKLKRDPEDRKVVISGILV